MYVESAHQITSVRWNAGKRLATTLLPVALTSVAVGCGDTNQAGPTAPLLSSNFLTASAQASLTSDGRFILRHSTLSPDIAEITETQARGLASAFLRGFGHFFLPALEKDRGGPISLARLQMCSRVFYAAGAYAPLPVTVPAVIRKATGPQWIVSFCAGDIPEVVVNVSAYATDAALSSDRTRFSTMGEANFQILGIPVGKEIPAQPENVAAMVAQTTKRKVASTPELVMRPRPMGPALAVWKIALDAPTTVSTGVKNWSTDEVFVGYFTDWQNQLLAADNDLPPAGPQDIVFDPWPSLAGQKTTVRVSLTDPRISQLTLVGPED